MRQVTKLRPEGEDCFYCVNSCLGGTHEKSKTPRSGGIWFKQCCCRMGCGGSKKNEFRRSSPADQHHINIQIGDEVKIPNGRPVLIFVFGEFSG